MVAALNDLAARSTPAALLDAALERLADAAVVPLEVFTKAGLPDQIGEYAELPDGSLAPIRIRPTPAQSRTIVGTTPADAVYFGPLDDIGERRGGADSALGFAAQVLRAIETVRGQLRQAAEAEDAERIRAIGQALWLGNAQLRLRLEFVEGPAIRATREQQAGCRSGGEQRAKAIQLLTAQQRAKWQAEADSIWSVKPGLSKVAVAERVRSRLDERRSVEVIRKAIKKPGR